MRFLARLVFANPTLLFTVCAVLVVALAVIAFIWSERRARLLAELSDDPTLLSGQRRRLAIVALVSAALLGVGAWWTFIRVHVEPQRLVIAISVDPGSHWWDDDPGARALAGALAGELEQVGLDPVGFDPDTATTLREAGDDPEALAAASRDLQARWLIGGRVSVDKTIRLELVGLSDYVMSVELELVDTKTLEVFEIPDMPMRVFLWGSDPSDAVARNHDYISERVTMGLIATLGARAPLLAYAGDRAAMTSDEAMLAASLEHLFLRADSHAQGLDLREKDRATARENEPKNHASIPQTRISDILAEEYFIGTTFDGRALLLSEPKHVGVVPNQVGYAVTTEGEELVLATTSERTLLFEHYNFYSAPALSADGRVVWTTVANHGASKSLASIDVETGEFAPILSHASEYYTSPTPAPDGARALFFSRPGRYAETSIELVNRDGSGRKQLIDPGEEFGLPAWAPDGRSFYIPIGAWERIVEIDIDTGERRRLLGQDPDAPPKPASEATENGPKPRPDPRHREPSIDHYHHGGPIPTAQPDSVTSSRFSAVSVGHTGRQLYVLEQSLDGRHWLGRFDLDAPDLEQAPAYVRLAQIKGGRLRASPAGPIVALEAPSFTATNDPETRDQEVIVFGPEPGKLRALTLNKVDDELAGWSRDGRYVFTIQRDRDPGSDRNPVVRLYRHDLTD